MDPQNKPQKPTEQADVAGLESEGVEIVSDIGDEDTGPKQTLEKTQDDLRETLAEIENGDSDIFAKANAVPATDPGRPTDSKAPKMYSGASPFIAPKEEPRKAPLPFVAAPHEGALSSTGGKILGTGPAEGLKRPVIGAGGKINLQNAIEGMLGNTVKPTEIPRTVVEEQKKAFENFNTTNDPSIKAIHTYQSDTKEMVTTQSISVAKMALAEARKNESEGTPIEYIDEEKRIYRKKILLVTLSFSLVFIGIGAMAYVYITYINPAPLPTVVSVTNVQSIIESEKSQNVDITNSYSPIQSFANTISTLPSNQGIVENINLIKKIDAGERLSTTDEIFGGNNTSIPFRVLKNIEDNKVMFGALVLRSSTPFIVFKISSFSNAWAGMLEWEKTIAKDLEPIIRVNRPDASISGGFIDEVISNKDARIIKDEQGDILLYSFIDSNTLVITTSRSVLKELVRRVTSATIIQ
jgi:hypothetical protein